MLKLFVKKFKGFRLRAAHQIVLGFVALILLGAFLLSLPISTISGEWTPFFDALFSSVGSVCITGITSIPHESLTIFGQIASLFLIELGAMGFMTATTLVMMIMRKKITLKNRLALQSALNSDSTKGIVRLVKNILILMFAIQSLGAIALIPVFYSQNGAYGIWEAVFYACSAFCNSGITPTNTALNSYAIIVMSILIVLGGLGFIVIMDTLKKGFRFKKLTVHSKIVLITTAILLFFGFISFFALEYSNPLTFKNKTLFQKLVLSFFESANARTAGFNITDQTALNSSTKLVRDVLIFIGASPGSTGGGTKTTTIAVLTLSIISSIKNRPIVTAAKHSVSQKTILKSVTVFGLSVFSIVILMFILLISEQNNANLSLIGGNSLENIFHISVSTLATSGHYGSFAPLLSLGGKWALMAAMLIGRLGLMTTGLVFTSDRPEPIIKYPEGNIILG